MNKFLLSLIFLPFILVGQPLWFYNINPKDNEIIGYGLANNIYEAKKYAIDEISKTLNVSINSNLDISKTYKKDSLINKDISSTINVSSTSNLSNIKFIKVKKIEDIWYVAALYDNSTMIQKIKKKYKSEILKNENQNKYLEKSILFKKINDELNSTLDFRLIRQNNLWYLKHQQNLFFLNQDDFYSLFYDYNDELKIHTNKITFNDNEDFKLEINTNKKGYLSLFNVQFDGKVGVLIENIKLDKKINIDGFKTVNQNNFQIMEQFIALFSENPIDILGFSKIENQMLDINDFNFTKLLELMNNYEFASKTIKINKGY